VCCLRPVRATALKEECGHRTGFKTVLLRGHFIRVSGRAQEAERNPPEVGSQDVMAHYARRREARQTGDALSW
jgi:hypothetical protein